MHKKPEIMNTNPEKINVLIIEDNVGDLRLVREMLVKEGNVEFDLTHADRVSSALDYIGAGGIDVVLLDLSLPDSQGIDTFIRIHSQAREIPIVVFTGLRDEELGVSAMNKGAQDYMVKGRVDSSLLVRSIRYAIERNRLQAKLRLLSLHDELTGLYNRRVLHEQLQMECDRCARYERSMSLLFVDVDDFKEYNDRYGHNEGDVVLVHLAEILQKSIKPPEMVFRLGGEEFVILLPETDAQKSLEVAKKICKTFEAVTFNTKSHEGYEACLHKTVSIGVAEYEKNIKAEEFVNRADRAMYKAKSDGKNRACIWTDCSGGKDDRAE